MIFRKERDEVAEDKQIILTYEGLKQLEDELQNLKVNRRREVAQKIKEAREQGDLSENAEYDAARDEQREIENRISEIDRILKNAVTADEGSQNKETVNFGSSVTFEDMETHTSYTYKLVGSTESDILNGKISNESPVGERLIGSKTGQIVTVETPNGTKNFKITNFWRE
ncbi:MAG: transcription elongation factor GreA [Eubacterium sp.]|nr:transcription elongation factor GreA [Eubacterium sp.]MBR6171875.1 transcription elongation factor GreA [Eubacterium sp.]